MSADTPVPTLRPEERADLLALLAAVARPLGDVVADFLARFSRKRRLRVGVMLCFLLEAMSRMTRRPPRAAVSTLEPGTLINYGMCFDDWFAPDRANPNELTGAILGGPDDTDNFIDKRNASSCTEPYTYINSHSIGPLAALAACGAKLVATH